MFSEALKILDRNTVNYMIDELQKELAEKSAMLEEKDTTIVSIEKEKELAIAEKDAEISKKNSALEQKDAAIAQLKKQLEEALAAAANTD